MQYKSAAVSSCGETSLWSDRCLPFSETSFLVKCEIPLFYDKHVEVKFSDRAGPGSHNGYTRGFPTNGVYTLKLQMESANLSSTTDESRVQLMSPEYNWSGGNQVSACSSLGFTLATSTGRQRNNGGSITSAGTFAQQTGWVFVGPHHPVARGPPASKTGTRW